VTGETAKPRGAGQPTAASKRRACVICGKPRDPRYAPFCSSRCADVDLHRWLKGTYVIPGAAAATPDGEDEE